MKRSVFLKLFAAFIILGYLVYSGCSDSSSTISESDQPQSTVSQLEQYFPLSTGRTLQYAVSNSETGKDTHERYVIGQGVSQNGHSGYIWIHTDLNYPDLSDTSYFYSDGTALYYYENPDARPEKILETPLETGRQWQRFEINPREAEEGTNLIYILTDGKYKNDEPDDARPIDYLYGAKSFPTLGSATMTVRGFEDIVLDNGQVIRDCCRIENSAGDYYNNYWYAPGVGLVKYIIGATEEELSSGTVAGELISAN